MQDREAPAPFDRKHAASYDEQWAKLAPLRDATHLLLRMVLSDLRDDARVLCVGVGTGSELLYLAQAFPGWRFTAVDPSASMLDVCRRRAEEDGIASRCAFHMGYLDTLPASDAFDAATCLLVSHFLLQEERQREFFAGIASRLRPDGLLVTSALASGAPGAYPDLLEVWMRMQRYTGASAETVARLREVYGRDVAVLPPARVASLLASSGFPAPVPFFQSLLIHAWYARRAPGSAPPTP